MKILFTTDLHGNEQWYNRLGEVARMAEVDVVINGGDILPKGGDLFNQDRFITGFLAEHFAAMDAAGIRYLCYLGNDDLAVFDSLFEETCAQYPLVTNLAQRLVAIEGYEVIGMNWVIDYPFRLKDRCRMDTRDYVFQQQFGSGLRSTPIGWKEIPDWQAYAATLPTIENEPQSIAAPQGHEQSHPRHPHASGRPRPRHVLRRAVRRFEGAYRLHRTRTTALLVPRPHP